MKNDQQHGTMKPGAYLFLALGVPVLLFGQQLSHPVMVSRDDAFSGPRRALSFPDTIKILAAMVQFQEDSDARTTGTGHFVVSTPTDPVIDAPPRNRQYFQDHLTFLENYYRKVSRGKVIVRSTVVDSVFTLPAVMAVYSPPKNGSNTVVANLARDTWRKVDSSGLVPDFSVYDCFVLFHAGVGHDVDLVATLGYDPTPLDIPSLYVGLSAFRGFYGPDYEGIPVSRGSFHITNSLVVPETESRPIPSVTGDVLLELGINGLLCASFGNFLGLPDLFNTTNGRSGIGRFGLMDGQAIFSFSGLFPPEPSAWEKYWLGWVTPITASSGTSALALPAVGLGVSDPSRADTVYKVPISTQEYFLVENRNRDPNRNGQMITSTFNGVARRQSFAHDTTGFNAQDISGLAGSVTDVEDLDWSLPGGVDEDGTFYDGGILIWHIDEAVINANIADDKVNADPALRGVDLEEADGSQDIGQQYDLLSPGSGSEEGTALDFWFQGNSATVYTNEFSAATHPNTNSNSGAGSHITFKNFSPRGARMSATVTRGDVDVLPLPGFPKATGETLPFPSLTSAPLAGGSAPEIIVATTGWPLDKNTTSGVIHPSGTDVRGKVYAWRSDSMTALPNFLSTGLIARSSGPGMGFATAVAAKDLNGGGMTEFLLGEIDWSKADPLPSLMRAFIPRDLNGDSLADEFFAVRGAAGWQWSTPAIADSIIAFPGPNEIVYFLHLNGSLIDSLPGSPGGGFGTAWVSRFTGSNTFIVTRNNGEVRITSRSTSGGVTTPDRMKSFGGGIVSPAAAGLFRIGNRTEACITFASATGLLYLVDADLNLLPGFPVNTGDRMECPPALADIDGDGSRDIVVFTHSRVIAYNSQGVPLDNFPTTPPTNAPILSYPIVADVDGDGIVEVIGVCEDGLVFAYNRYGRMVRGFPLQAGKGAQSPAVFDVLSPPANGTGIGFAVASAGDGSVSAWRTGVAAAGVKEADRPWPQYQHDPQHTGLDVTALSGTPISNEFFPKNRAYNWPNPVYEGRTFLRYYVKDNATVKIKVFDLAGDLVTEFSGPGVGGLDNEAAWDVSNVQSGIYFARIEAVGPAGSGVVIVKVAVVK